MRSTVFATAVGSVVALVGFAGTANASATVDLIWIDKTDTACTDDGRRDCPRLGATISSVAVRSDNITLAVILTAGPGGILAGGVSVDYNEFLPTISVVGFQSLTTKIPFWYLPATIPTTTKQSPFIDNINAHAVFLGIGLPSGVSAYLGTVSFHKDATVNGIFEISVGTNGPGNTDAILDSIGNNITTTTTFNSAFLVVLPTPTPMATPTPTPTPICSLVIEVNTLRTGGKKVRAGANQTVDVTAKARILKGTAIPGTVIDTLLTIQAVDGTDVIGTNSAGPIQLEIGKGGKGAKLAVDVPQCTTGFIDFVATFSGVDANNSPCEKTGTLRRQCR